MTSVSFDLAFSRTVGNEGGFQKLAGDRANWTTGQIGVGVLKGTKFGISAMSYPNVDIENLTIDQAKAIYYADWWQKLGMDLFRPALSYQMFDAAINHGMGNASKMLQRAVRVTDDGVVGKGTMAAVNLMPLDDLLMRFLAQRLKFMAGLGTWGTFGKGWAVRIANNLELAAEDTSC